MSPVDVDGLRERVNKTIEAFVADRTTQLLEVSADAASLAEAIDELLRGGKRLRAAFCYWAFRGAGGVDGDEIVAAAAAMELFQAAALIHDDVMDDSDTRRGMPAVHRRFAAHHERLGLAGDPAQFGLAAAVLAGDLCLVWSDELFTQCGLDAVALRRARGPFDRMRTQLMAGQYLDMLEQVLAREEGAVDAARQVIRYKSAKYTVEEPLQIGAALAGADQGLLTGLRGYGLPLGEAFQLRDDVLGVFGDPEVTGKPAGDDLREGKRTVLIGLTLRSADEAGRQAVQSLLGRPDLTDLEVQELRGVIERSGALAATEALIEERVAASSLALARLPALGLSEAAHGVLHDLIAAATQRCA